MDKPAEKYAEWISDSETFITANILNIIENKKEFEEIIEKHRELLDVCNESGVNSLNILLANHKFKEIEQIVKFNNINLMMTNHKERLIHSMLKFPQTYDFLLDIIPKISRPYILTSDNANRESFIVCCTQTFLNAIDAKENADKNLCVKLLTLITTSLQTLFSFNTFITFKYDASIELTKVVRIVEDDRILKYIISQLDIKNVLVFPLPETDLTIIDYMIYHLKFDILDTFLDVAENIMFVDLQDNSLFMLIQGVNNEIHKNSLPPVKQIIAIILKIISKSNIYDIYDKNGTNIIMQLLSNFKLENAIDYKVMSMALQQFDIFEQNIFGESIFSVATKKLKDKSKQLFNGKYLCDIQVKLKNPYNIDISTVDYNFDVSKILTKTKIGAFIADIIHANMYYYLLCEKYASILHPMYYKNSTKITENADNVEIAMNYFVSNCPNLLDFKIFIHATSYFVSPQIIDIVKNSTKRFIVIDVTFLGKIVNHSNVVIIDKNKKTVERYEPFGSLYFVFPVDEILQETLSEPLNYKYILCKTPGFQSQSVYRKTETTTFGDEVGYCLAWCLFMVEMRLTYPDIDICKMIKIINNYIINRFFDEYEIENIENNKHLVFIRFYGKNLQLRQDTLNITHGMADDKIYDIIEKKYKSLK